MEDGLVLSIGTGAIWICASPVLILVVMEDGLVLSYFPRKGNKARRVLILVVMEDGLVHANGEFVGFSTPSLNPCCNGRWSRTIKSITIMKGTKKS